MKYIRMSLAFPEELETENKLTLSWKRDGVTEPNLFSHLSCLSSRLFNRLYLNGYTQTLWAARRTLSLDLFRHALV